MEKKKTVCLSCGATNNYPMGIAEKKVVCGRCRSPMRTPGELIEGNREQLEILIQKSSIPVLVDFYSPACAPCRMMHPIIAGLIKRRAGEIIGVQVNTEQHPEIASGLGIQAVPTFIVFLRGQERGRTAGAMSEADFAFWVASLS